MYSIYINVFNYRGCCVQSIYFHKTDLEPKNCGYMQFGLYLWALSGYIQILRTLRAKHMS